MAIEEQAFMFFVLLGSICLPSTAMSAIAKTGLEDSSAAARLVRSENNSSASRATGAMFVSSSGTAIAKAGQTAGSHSLMEVASHDRDQMSGSQGSVTEGAASRAVTGKIEMDFFTGQYPEGTRSDVFGHVGFSFKPHVDFRISSLGRKLNKHGVVVAETNLTLWGPSHEVLAQLRIGPECHKEGGFIWKELPTPVDVKAHMEYRLTQECAVGMADPWWDGFLHQTEINVHDQTAEAYADLHQGVSSNEAFSFPTNLDGMGRRAGMLNFRIEVVPTYAKSRCCSNAECTRHTPLDGDFTFSQCMDKCRYAKHHLTLEGDDCMGIEFGYSNQCATTDTCKCVLVREGGCGKYEPDVEWNFFTVAGPAHTVRLSQKHSGRVEVLHDKEWGTVCENGFSEFDAIVVCRQMHMWDGSTIAPQKLPGTGTGKIWMSEVMCEGGEPRIEECTFAGWGTHSCTHRQDVGVQCVLPMPGARGKRGPPGVKGVPADKTASDYISTVVGPKGLVGPPGNPGPRGHKGIDGKDGEAGYLLDHAGTFIIDTWYPTDALVTLPVFIFFVGISIGSTYLMWWFAQEKFINPKVTKLQDYLTDEKEPWKAYYGDMSATAKRGKKLGGNKDDQ